jgi:predicted MFS family arabinose efflux permease
MWAALGIAGAAVGVFGGGIANRYGLRGPLAVMLVLVGGSTLVLLVAPGSWSPPWGRLPCSGWASPPGSPCW